MTSEQELLQMNDLVIEAVSCNQFAFAVARQDCVKEGQLTLHRVVRHQFLRVYPLTTVL